MLHFQDQIHSVFDSTVGKMQYLWDDTSAGSSTSEAFREHFQACKHERSPFFLHVTLPTSHQQVAQSANNQSTFSVGACKLQDVTLLHCTGHCSCLPTQPVCTTFSRGPQRRTSAGVSLWFFLMRNVTFCKWSSRHSRWQRNVIFANPLYLH